MSRSRASRLIIAVVCLAAAVVVVWRLTSLSLFLGIDGLAYLGAGAAVLRGESPVGADPNTYLPIGIDGPRYVYPPPLAVLVAPLAALPYPQSAIAWLLLVLLATLTLVPLLAAIIGGSRRYLWAAGAVLLWWPAWNSLIAGQVNALIACLLAAALLTPPGRAGALLTAGALLKLTPGPALAALILRAPRRALPAAALTIAAALALTVPLVGLEAWRAGVFAAQETHLAPQFTHSLVRWAEVLVHPLAGPALAAALVALTLWRGRALPLELALAGAMLVPLLAARLAWPEHAVMALPALAVMVRAGGRLQIAAMASWAILAVGGPLTAAALLAWAAALDVGAQPVTDKVRRSAGARHTEPDFGNRDAKA